MDGCIEWKGARNPQGYGQKCIKGKRYRTHRLAWEWANGPIPEGLFVLHKCDNPPCCNPDHLFLGTQTDNMQDMLAKGRGINGGIPLTHCPKGHEYVGHNLIIHVRGFNVCRICKNASNKRYHLRKRLEKLNSDE